MSIKVALQELDKEIARLQAARKLMNNEDIGSEIDVPRETGLHSIPPRRKFTLSAASRKKMAEAQRKRWADKKAAAGKKTA